MQIEKALDILETFINHTRELGISDLAKLAKINISTAYRIASVLVQRGYLTQNGKWSKYYLGHKLLEFCPLVLSGMTIWEIAHPLLEELNDEINESVNLAILDLDVALVIDNIQSRRNLRYVSRVGERLPLHSTGLGKVMLAHMKEEELEKFFQNNQFPAYTKNTITDPSHLKQELDIIRAEGIAIDNEENELGTKCFAAPLKDKKGNITASFSIAVPSARLNDLRTESFKVLIKDFNRQISRAMALTG